MILKGIIVVNSLKLDLLTSEELGVLSNGLSNR